MQLLGLYTDMKKFKYHALDQNGQEVTGEVAGFGEIDVVNFLRGRGLYPTSVNEVTEKKERKVIELKKVEEPTNPSTFKIPWRDFFLVLLGYLLHWWITAIS